MTEAERVLADLAAKIHSHDPNDWPAILELTAPYLNKPKPADVLAEAFVDIGWSTESSNGYRPDRLRAMLAKRGYAVIKIDPKPEPDRLTVAARECYDTACYRIEADALEVIRAIIAREVAAAEPSDEAIDRVIGLLIVGRGVNHKTVRAALKREIGMTLADELEALAKDGWQDIANAPVNTPVRVKAGNMTFIARIVLGASMTSDEQECNQWQAEHEGEHPPCWSGGACWESNEDEAMSLQPTYWQPIAALRQPDAVPGSNGSRVDSAVELMGEALFALSDRLRQADFIHSDSNPLTDVNFNAYQRVGKAWDKLTAAIAKASPLSTWDHYAEKPVTPCTMSDAGDVVPRDVAESWKAKAKNYQKEREELLADISDMMANYVDNWPSPKQLKTAIALIGKTLDRMVSKDRQPDAVPGDLAILVEQMLSLAKHGGVNREWCSDAAAAIQSLTAERDAALARVAELEKCVLAADKLCDATVRLTNASSALLEGSKP